MIVSETQPPPLEKMIQSVHHFKRGLDPEHSDTLPDAFNPMVWTERRAGWLLLDFWGTELGFIADGTEIA